MQRMLGQQRESQPAEYGRALEREVRIPAEECQ
jgi:hypothetical protein